MKRAPISQGESGQSTLEFALTLLLLMGFVLFYIQLSLVMAFGNYVHYATFMAARAQLSAGATQEDQTQRAEEVLKRMLKKRQGAADRFAMIAKGEGGKEVPGLELILQGNEDPTLIWRRGVRYTFKSRLFMIPLGGGGGSAKAGSVNSLTLKAESWLGREPAYMECQTQMGTYFGLFDNGC